LQTLFFGLHIEDQHTRKMLYYKVLGLIIIAAVFSIYLYQQSWYSVFGRDPLTVNFVFADGGIVHSPNGKNSLHLAYWDAGAAHSGNFGTFVTTKHWLKGRQLLAQGYSSYPVRYGSEAFPIEWVDDDSFWVSFVGHRDAKPHRQFVRIE
jgi:hypothetical protein